MEIRICTRAKIMVINNTPGTNPNVANNTGVTQMSTTYVHVMDAVWSDKGHQLLVNALQEIAADRERW